MNIFKKFERFFCTKILRKTYKRVGKCNGCGKCCSHIYVKHLKGVIQTEEEFKKLQYLHSFYANLEILDKDEIGLIFECNFLDKETKKCTIHKKRPGICRRYPQEEIFMMGGSLSENCGYKLIPYYSFEEILKAQEKKADKTIK